MTSQPFLRLEIIVGSAGLVNTHDDTRKTFSGIREQIISASISFLTVPFMRIFIDDHHEACMNNDLILADCYTWTNSGTFFLSRFQMFAELLGLLFRHNSVSVIRCVFSRALCFRHVALLSFRISYSYYLY